MSARKFSVPLRWSRKTIEIFGLEQWVNFTQANYEVYACGNEIMFVEFFGNRSRIVTQSVDLKKSAKH